ncbi:nicotinamide riboside transporter PnuC [Niabella yanshanensis]|uniref:Nicotinamide riboside transporter PnuC n=1 Tax=Niabella yanshanensis TaxID=577386 RepID=A0ABZ0W1Q7_9BACT|nr:nicotinamide riboside transporter PnuC [Niabella yanshanensis]WQD37021.1 nicotinamide riboside transporter PnuC [Niabella yanshanensis]
MNPSEWFQLFLQQLKAVPLLEWIGVSFGVAEVLLARANKIWLYPCGIVSVMVSTYIFFHSGLYAESALNMYYLVMSIYGWWWWQRRKDHDTPPVTRATKTEWLKTIGIVVSAFVILYTVLTKFTDSTVPVFDSWVSATAWAGMWLLAKRKIENWILLNISNAFAIPLLFYKGLPLYALLTLFLFIIAVLGYIDWNKTIKKNEQKTAFSFE